MPPLNARGHAFCVFVCCIPSYYVGVCGEDLFLQTTAAFVLPIFLFVFKIKDYLDRDYK